MRLLVDTNIFLEVILEQEKAQAARDLLSKAEEHEFFISDYSLHSVGLLLFRRKQYETFRRFLSDMILNGAIRLMALPDQEMEAVVDVAQRFNLNFDDAYQYAIAERYGLIIVSFDADFDRTDKGRKKPDEIL